MRKRYHVETLPRTRDAKLSPDHFFQLCAVDELHDGQPTDWNHEARLQNFDFPIHPRRAVANLIRSRNAICPTRILSGKTAADGCEINSRSDRGFIHPAKFFEPAKKCLPCGMRERSLQDRFSRPRGLTNDHYVAHDRAAGDWRRFHPWATTAAE